MSGEESRFSTGRLSEGVKSFLLWLGLSLLGAVLFFFLVWTRGVVEAIVYEFLFFFCIAFFPALIGLLGNAVPNSVGKLHIVLGAFAFNHHYLVERENRWEWCPGDRGQVYIDDEWHDVTGLENYSVLGWRPFGILRYKDDETWADKRVDQKALRNRDTLESDPSTDGGTVTVERGGWEEADRPTISGVDGTWLLDLKRIYSRGIKKIGDIELIETAEEVIERGQVKESRMGNWGPFVETVVGLTLGIMCGYGYVLLA